MAVNKELAELKIKGLALKLKLEIAKEEYEQAKKREENIHQAAIVAKDFFTEDGKLINNGKLSYMICKEQEQDFYKVVKDKWLSIYGLDYPINYTPTFTEYGKPYYTALKEYRAIAVEFLKITGHEKEAQGIQEALNTYIRPALAERLDQLTDRWIIGNVV